MFNNAKDNKRKITMIEQKLVRLTEVETDWENPFGGFTLSIDGVLVEEYESPVVFLTEDEAVDFAKEYIYTELAS